MEFLKVKMNSSTGKMDKNTCFVLIYWLLTVVLLILMPSFVANNQQKIIFIQEVKKSANLCVMISWDHFIIVFHFFWDENDNTDLFLFRVGEVWVAIVW